MQGACIGTISAKCVSLWGESANGLIPIDLAETRKGMCLMFTLYTKAGIWSLWWHMSSLPLNVCPRVYGPLCVTLCMQLEVGVLPMTTTWGHCVVGRRKVWGSQFRTPMGILCKSPCIRHCTAVAIQRSNFANFCLKLVFHFWLNFCFGLNLWFWFW